MPFNAGEYDVTCYVLSTIGDSPWLVSKENAEKALKTPNYHSKNDTDYDTPYNWLEASEWEIVKVALNIEDSMQPTIKEYCENTRRRKIRREQRKRK